MDHDRARRLVSAGRESSIRAMHRLDDRRRLLDHLVQLGLWAVGAGLSCYSFLHLGGGARLLACVTGYLVSGTALNESILLMHEGMHMVLFRRRALNRWVGVLCGASVLMSFSAYQIQHLKHHAFLGQAGDPDEYNNYAQAGWRLWALHCTRVLCGSILYIFFIPGLSWARTKGAVRKRIFTEFALIGALIILLFMTVPTWALIQAWGYPLLVVNFMMNFRGLANHSLAEPRDAFLASRNLRCGPVVRFLLLQENYHMTHHLYPLAPSYRLHQLDSLLRDRYPREASGPGFLWFLGCFFRALWLRDGSPIGIEEHP
jgi:fatty acid desaturase